MRAAVLTKLNAPLEIMQLVHSPPEFGQVLVKIHQSGICGAQLQEIRGEKGNEKYLPHLLGHEGAGEVLYVGSGVTRVKVGDKVVCHWRKADGVQGASPGYATAFGIVRGGPVTTFATAALISENRLTPVPQDTPNDLCALLGCGLSTALGTIENEADLKFGETVLIIGCGGLGANLILAALLRQASFVGVLDCQDKGTLALDMGANVFGTRLEGLLQQRAYDVIIDTTGSFSAVRDAFPLLASGGRFIMVGQPKPGASMEIPNARDLFNGDGKRIIATQGGGFRPDRDVPKYIAMWRAGLLKADGLITHRFPLQDVNEAIAMVRNGQAGRVMLDCQ